MAYQPLLFPDSEEEQLSIFEWFKKQTSSSSKDDDKKEH